MKNPVFVLPVLAAGLCIVSPTARCATNLNGMLPADVKTVGLVSVSSIIPKEKFERGTNLLARAGYRVKAMPNVLRLVSPDERARRFEQAWMDPEIDFLLFSCGGQGASNVISRIDWERLRKRDMRVMGFSDVTLVLNAMDVRKAGHPIAGPMLSTLVTYCSKESREWLRQVLDGTPPPVRLHPVKPCAAPVRGRPIGGLLSRFPVLKDMGLLPSFAGRVVILECTPKYADRAEADLDVLIASGAFDGAAAVVLADFNRKWERERTDALFVRFAAKVKCPVFSGYPFGHVARSFAFDFTRPLTIAPDGVMGYRRSATTGDVTLKAPAWKPGDRNWPIVYAKLAVNDWSGYDRLAIDVTNLGDGGDQVGMDLAGPTGRMGDGLCRRFELPAWETVRWEVLLNYWEDTAAKSNEVARMQFNSYRPRNLSATFSGFTLLKPGEVAPAVRTPSGLADALRRGRSDYEHRLVEERRAFVAGLRAANARDGICNGKMLYGVGTAMEQVRPKRTRTLKSAAEVRMRLARNEWEGRQIFVTPAEGALKGVSVGVSPLVHADGRTVFPAAEIRVLTQGYVRTRRFPRYGVGYNVPTNAAPGYVRLSKRADLGWWPDMLLDFLPMTDIAAGDVQGFWISVHAPEGQLAGDYRGRVTISAADAPAITLPFLVHVNGFDLPKTPVIPTLVSFNPSVHVAKGREHEYGDIARAFRADPESPINVWSRHRMEWADFLADHFITMAPLYHHGFDLPYDAWDRLKAQGRMGLYNLCYFGVSEGQKTSPEELEKWGKWVKSVIAKNYEKAKEHGLERNCLVYCCDEAPANRFPAIDAVMTMMKKRFPDVTFVTTSYDNLYGTGDLLRNVDVFCPQPDVMDTALADRSRAEGHKVWWYFANCQLAPQANIFTECQPSEIRLFMGAMAARYRPDGFLYYQCAYFNNRRCVTTGPYTDWDPRSFRDEHGDATWMAVGPDGRPLTTVRLENFRDGLEDLAYVKLVEERSGRRVRVPEALVESLKNYTDDPEAIEAWRNRLADELETGIF